MSITVNGKPEEISGPIRLLDFLASKGIHSESVVIELNREILEKTIVPDVILKENDTLEILRFVGGG